MSRLMDALQRAQQEKLMQAQRHERSGYPAAGQPPSGGRRDDAWDHVRDLEDAFRRREAPRAQPAPSPAAPKPEQPSAAPAPSPSQPASVISIPVNAPPQMDAALPDAAATPIEKRLSEIQEELAQCEELAVRQQGACASLKAQAAAYADLSAQLSRQQQDASRQLAQAEEASASIEAARQFWHKQLQAVLSCQALSRAARVAEEELAQMRQIAGLLAQSQQRLTDEQTRTDQRCVQLQALTERLHAQMQLALASVQATENRP